MELLNRNEFGKLLDELKLYGNGIEIGVANGTYSKIIIETFPLSKIYLLDSWKHYNESEYPDVQNRMQDKMDKVYGDVLNFSKQYGDKVTVIRKESVEGSKDFIDCFFDFVYIDANHTYKWVKDDVENWYPKVRNGGILAGHDYFNGNLLGSKFEVKKAVDEFAIKINKLVTMVPGGRKNKRLPSWYIIK